MADLDKKWSQVVQYAREYATRNGLHKGEPWVRDAFNDYFALHEKQVEAGRAMSFGGQSFSLHNREVMAEMVHLQLRNSLTDDEAKRLRDTLHGIALEQERGRGLRR